MSFKETTSAKTDTVLLGGDQELCQPCPQWSLSPHQGEFVGHQVGACKIRAFHTCSGRCGCHQAISRAAVRTSQ